MISSKKGANYICYKGILTFTVAIVLFVQGLFAQSIATYPLATGGGNPTGGTANNVNANVSAGAMAYGTSVQNGGFNSSGYRVKTQSLVWPTTPTDGFSFDFPISPKSGFDISFSSISFDYNSLDYDENSTILYVQPFIKIDNTSDWIKLADAKGLVASPATGTVTFPAVLEPFYNGHTYVIRFYVYAAGANEKNDNFRVRNFIFSGNTTSPPKIPPAIASISAAKSLTAPKYSGVVKGTYNFGPTFQDVKEAGVVWSTATNPTVNLTTKLSDGVNGNINSTITGLSANTTYYARPYIITQAELKYGAELSFTTDPPSVPTVSTDAVSNILSNKATCGGVIPDSGGVAITDKGLVWGTTPSPTTASTGKLSFGKNANSFTDLIKGLTPSTKYYVRAYAINSLGVTYGNEQNFTTAAPAPVLISIPGSLDFGENYYNSNPLTISYNLKGESLSPSSGNITVTAPTGFLVSLKGNSGFAQSITVPYSGGRLSNTAIYAQLPSSKYGSFTGNITHSGGGVTSADADLVKVSGNIIQSQEELTNRGTDFWLGFGYEEKMNQKAGASAEAKLSVYISAADLPAQVIVDLPGIPGATGFPKTINVPANGIVEVTGFPTGDSGSNTNAAGLPDTRLYSTGISNKGIHVYSTNGTPIAVWMHTYADNNSAAGAMLFPSNTWSSEYVVQAYGGQSNNGNPNSFFFVIANEDNTEIEFTPSNDILNGDASVVPFKDDNTASQTLYKRGQTYKITLNKGQVFNAMGFIQGAGSGVGAGKALGLDLTGTKVKTTCDKKIAVFGGNGRVLVTSPTCTNTQGSDNLIQQMFPTVAWGTKYLTAPTKNMENNLFRIVVSDPNTNVKKDGVTLNASSLVNNLYYQVESNKPMLVESDKPINVTQFILVGGGCSLNIGDGDPEMIILSPVQQAINKATVYSAGIKKSGSSVNGHYINVVISKKAIDNKSFKLDNVDFNSTTKIDVGGTGKYSSLLVLMKDAFKVHPQDPNYYYAIFKVTSGAAHTISSDYEFNAIAYGMGDGESYGYNAGTAIKNLNSIKIAVNPDGVDTSSTVVRTGKNNPVTLRIALPHNPTLVDKITWNPGSDVRITPTGTKDGELDGGKAKYDGTIDIEGRTFYVYTSPVSYQFSEEGIYKITATALGTFASSCQGEDVQKIAVVVGRDNINFDFKTTCGNPKIEFINSTTAMPGTTINTWAWDFGDGSTSNLKDPLPHTYDISKGYKYTVKLTTTNSVGSITTDSIKVDFSGGIETKFTSSAKDVCAGTKITFDPSSTTITGTTSGTPVSWTWDFGEGTPLVVSGTTSPAQEHTYLVAGKFPVKLTLKTSNDCENTFVDTVLVGSAPSSLIEASAVKCIGDSVQYTDKSTIDFGKIKTWTWTFDDGTTSALQNPKHIWVTAGNHKATLTVTSEAGCPAINVAEHVVNVLPLPTALFTNSTPICVGSEVIFTDASTANTTLSAITEWTWDFGDGSPVLVKTTGDPVKHTYTTVATVTAKLTVKSAGGCQSIVYSKTIVVNPIPEPDFTFSDVCVPVGKAIFSASNKNAGTISTWVWDFGDGQAGTGQNPIHNYTAGGIYKVTLTATNSFGCPVTVSKDVTVYTAPTASFEVANINGLCGDAPVQITDKSVVNGYGTIGKLEIYWDYLNNPTQVISENAPSANGIYTNQYPLPTTAIKKYRILIRAYTATGCFTETYQDIVLNAIPVALLNTFAPICEEAGAFTLTGGSEERNLPGTGVYTGNGVDANGMFSPLKAGPGTHQIIFTYTTTAGCTSFAQQDIVVNPTPDVSFRDKVIYVKDQQSATLAPHIEKGDNLIYKWSPGTYLSNPNIANPICSPINDIVYTVTVTSPSGCIDTAKLTVNILREILVRNTFTPNGDGVNDTWDILYFDTYPGATLEVFNRYGKKIFNSTVSNMPWDGKFKGEDLPVGTYYYIIDPKNGAKAITGAVTIIR